jgi:ABC-type sulfate/molybdate transport systems ATPase subunit
MSEQRSDTAAIEMRGARIAALRDPSLTVLENVEWSVRAGEFWVVAGPPHSGKSDLLLHAAGMVAPTEGVCRVFGCDTLEFDERQIAERLRVGFVFADGKLFNQLTVAENVALPLRYHRDLKRRTAPPVCPGEKEPLAEAEIAHRVAALLELVELPALANVKPANLAAVWRQRAALARALALQPELLLLDEPGRGLTARHRQWLVNFLDRLWRGHDFFGGRPMTLVVTTEDLSPWQQPQRQFAAVHGGHLAALGAWGGAEFLRSGAVKELMPGSGGGAM